MDFYSHNIRQINALIDNIHTVFANVVLGDGVGLIEGDKIDSFGYTSPDFRCPEEEREDWRRISINMLWEYERGLLCLDNLGTRFVLPALLVHSLHTPGFEYLSYSHVFNLLRYDNTQVDIQRFSLLNPNQYQLVIDYLQLVRQKILATPQSSGLYLYSPDLDDVTRCIRQWQEQLADFDWLCVKVPK